MNTIAQRAFFVTPFVNESGGVDYLGLRQANLELMDRFMPGINNRTFWIRPYSVMCWMVWTFERQRQAETAMPSPRQRFERFREKIEVLFGWSHQLHNDGTHMAGNGQYCPPGEQPLPLTFKDWHRGPSWFDAVQYGPSFKPETGLGLAWPEPDGTYRVTPAGEALARALDDKLRRLPVYHWLNDLEDNLGSTEQASAVYPLWKRGEPGATEAQVFRDEFYPPPAAAKNRRALHRQHSIDLILATLRLTGATSLPQLRRAMVLLPLSAYPAPSEELAASKALWSVLQLRQAQRLAFETLFGWLERNIQSGLYSSEALRDRLLALAATTLPRDSKVNDLLQQLHAFAPQGQNLLQAGLRVSELDLLGKVDSLLWQLPDNHDQAANEALQLLFLSAAITQDLNRCDHHQRYLDQGGQARLSLLYWTRSLELKGELSLFDLTLNLIENHLLSQHFGIAAIRMTEAKPRLRISLEEQGLHSLLDSADEAWQPGLTEDRLYSTLELLRESRLIDKDWCEESQEQLYRYAT